MWLSPAFEHRWIKNFTFYVQRLNRRMRTQQNYLNTAAYAEAQTDYLNKFSSHCDYAITLQTTLHTYGTTQSTMEQRLYQVQASLRILRNKLNRLLTGNGYKRNEKYLPVFIAAIEGTTNIHSLNRTLHIHIALGNTGHEATEQTRSLLEDGIRQIWQTTQVGTKDVRVDRLAKGTETRWMSYIGKEASKGNTGVIDYSNTQIPNHLLNT